MDAKELLLDFLQFHYRKNPFRKQETNEQDVDDYLLYVNKKNTLPLRKCAECGSTWKGYERCPECFPL